MDPAQVDIPPMKDLTIDNITENVHTINSRCPDSRTKYLFERLIAHIHDFARETRLSTSEWMTAIEFLTKVGQMCTDVRQVAYPSITSPATITSPLTETPTGIHPSLRHPRSLPPRRLYRSPQATTLHRRHSPRPIPHP